MSENKIYDTYIFMCVVAVIFAVILFFAKEHIAAAILCAGAIVLAYSAEKNHPVKKIIKIKPKKA